jgi:hexokinase
MVVNTEWGAMDNGVSLSSHLNIELMGQRHVLPISIFDNKLDRESINPSVVMFP